MLSLSTTPACRYRIEGTLPSPYDDAFHARLTDRRFLPLGPTEEATFGWVTADNLLVTRFDVDTVIRGEHAVLGLRVDQRKPDPRLLRAQIELEVDAHRKAASDAGRPFRLTREERQQIKADVHEALLRETNPRVQAHTVLLSPKRRLLWMLALGRGANETLVRLFRDTFQLELTPLTPWHRGQEILAGQEVATALDSLTRSEFAIRPVVAPTTDAEPVELSR